METCPETRTLIQWLNGALPKQETDRLENHIESCEPCNEKLLNLTDDFSLQPPTNPDELLGKDNTFTNEPHFRSMRERVARNISDLKSDSENKKSDGGLGQMENLVDVAVRPDEIETIEANAASTQNSGQGGLALEENESTESVRIEGFLLEAHIGTGGFAHVFKAWEKELARPVAIKLLDKNRINARNRHRFLREAKAASSVRSPHVVQVLTSGEAENGQPYIAMELVEGDTLAQWIAKRSKTLDSDSISQGVGLLEQVCRGVQAVHDASLIHRDIKPGNIFVDADSTTAKLGDFGLIRILDEDTVTLTRAAELAGTPAYMSPEQTVANSDLDATSDVYGLGASLYQTLTGQPPFRGSSVAILKQVNEQQPLPPRQLNENVSKDLETICLKALEKEPQRRYQSAALLAEDLSAAIEGRPIAARPVSGPGKLLRWAKRNRALATALSLLFVSLLAGTITSTAFWLRSDHHAKRSEANATTAEANAIKAKTSALAATANAKKAESSAMKAEMSAMRATRSRSQLVQSVKKLVSSTFTRKSAYIAMSGQDREKAVTLMSQIYREIIDGQTEYDSDLMRELMGDIAAATEINLELSNYSRAADLLSVSIGPAEQLVVENGFQLKDRILAAKIYNQFGDYLNEHKGHRQNNKAGAAIWKAAAMPELETAEAYMKVLEFADVDSEPDSDIAFERTYANFRMTSLETPGDGISKEEHAAQLTAKMFGMMERVKGLRQANPDLSVNWMMLHQRILLDLSKRHQGIESVDYRVERARVFKEFVTKLENRGEETFWYDRSIAVNDFFTGMGYLRVGNVEMARPTIIEAKDRLEKLAAAYPRVIQFRADLAEALLIIANIDWNEASKESAMGWFKESLEAFELCMKTDQGEVGLRRRLGRVYDIVGMRHLEMENRTAATECFKKGMLHTQIVLAAPYDSDLKESDAKTVKAFEEKLAELEADE